MEKKQWHVVHIRPQWERIVYHQLRSWYNLEAWCPLKKERRQWSDRIKTVETPLFKGYVFVRVGGYPERIKVLQLDGVVKFVQYEREPAVIREQEMEMLKKFTDQHTQIEVGLLEPGKVIQLTKGALGGIEGIIKSVSRNKVILELPRLGFKLTASQDTITDLII